MIGWALRQAVMWSALGLICYGALSSGVLSRFANQAPSPEPAHIVGEPPPAAPTRHDGPVNSLTFPADRQGHVRLDASVNGAAVKFLVDTGATMVVLTLHDAEAAGIGLNSLEFTMRTMTANGPARAAPVQLREVRIGQLSLYDVSAAVVEHVGISLLGQSFLTRLDSYEMRDGVLTLNWN
ncbi:MAG TPA: TIGR02281 family clan AA aspartic protease [Stellaceae bacterium]|nr:TIGR02281 family clan AA aspartic protease [Stellaceae bacterium]